MTKLSPHAKQAVDYLADKHLAYTLAKVTIEAELKREFQERIHSFKLERDTALRLAAEAGVPRTQLGKTIGTSNYRTVQEILSETDKSSSVAVDSKWSLVALPEAYYSLSVHEIGPAKITGTAVVDIQGTEIELIEGEPAVLTAIYRFGYADAICESVR